MSSPLNNSPAEIVRALLIALGLGVTPPSGSIAANGTWPVYATNEPNAPDDCITVYDGTNQQDGRDLWTGQLWVHYGVQVRVRSVDHPTGYQKVYAIKKALAEQVGGVNGPIAVTVGNNNYLVHAMAKIGPLLVLGKDAPSSKRSLFTLNALLVL